MVDKSSRGFGSVQQISGPAALGTQLLAAKTPGPGQWVPPPLPKAPEPTRRPPILRSIDEDIRPVPPPPVIVNANAGPTIIGRSLTSNKPAPPPAAVRSFDPSDSPSPNEDYIPIIHNPSLGPVHARARAGSPPPTVVIPPTPSDDGFTPVTPTPASPTLKGLRLSRAPPLPRDALGIPAGRKFVRSKSKRVQIEDDDSTPLSPTSPRNMEAKQKPKRKTLWGVIEGWWDLGLLERSKSLRRKV
ncbi:hypothetical protein F4677DRAFT_176709 [Hypoxylon crocopeplum]|nr:hypothetical protein F4677DRAFT_176709 [Hypoxylon crocopeplum]